MSPKLVTMNMDYTNNACNTAPRKALQPELHNFDSEHAVAGGNPPTTAPSLSSPLPTTAIDIRRKSLSRKSLYLNDVLMWQGKSLGGSSLMSSLTLTDCEDSFYNDFGSKFTLSGWEEAADEEDAEDFDQAAEDVEVMVSRISASYQCSTLAACDDMPKRPARRESAVEIACQDMRHCCGQGKHQGLLDFGEQQQQQHPTKMYDNSDQDQHPIKPGRRGSLEVSMIVKESRGLPFRKQGEEI